MWTPVNNLSYYIDETAGGSGQDAIRTGKNDVSLIAMSPHGKSWFEDAVMGNTAFAVANTVKTPVLIIRENKGVQP
ncbi:MAG: hypothetical protein STSR0009_00590 [Methanoregula sp.]